MRTWKKDGPPEIVDGMVMNVMPSCSLRPARRARKPPMAWMPSCELPAMRMTASLIFCNFGAPPDGGTVVIVSLMEPQVLKFTALQSGLGNLKENQHAPIPHLR